MAPRLVAAGAAPAPMHRLGAFAATIEYRMPVDEGPGPQYKDQGQKALEQRCEALAAIHDVLFKLGIRV